MDDRNLSNDMEDFDPQDDAALGGPSIGERILRLSGIGTGSDATGPEPALSMVTDIPSGVPAFPPPSWETATRLGLSPNADAPVKTTASPATGGAKSNPASGGLQIPGFDQPKLNAPIGAGQPNRADDLLTVQRLYNRLIDSGHMIYDDGALPLPRKIPESGRYDQATQDALRDFEKRYFYGKASPDGVVRPDGSLFQTMTASVTNPETAAPKLAAEVHGLARVMVPGGVTAGRNGVDRIQQHLPLIVSALEDQGIADPDMLLMALATIRAESSGFAPIPEGKSKYNTSATGGHDFDLYDQKNGNRGAGEGYRFRGRGFVQLTGRDNYQNVGRQIGHQELVNDPDKANDPQIAAQVLAQFLKNHESEIRAALKNGDLKTARRLVNGGSHGLADFTAAYQAGQQYMNRLRSGKAQ